MRFQALSKIFKSNGYVLKDHGSRQRSLNQFVQACQNFNIKIDRNIDQEEYLACAEELAANPAEKSVGELVKEKLNPQEIFGDFEKREDGKGSPILRYTNPVTGDVHTFGSLDDYNEYRKVVKALLNFGQPTLERWVDTLIPFTTQLKIGTLTETKAAEQMWENLFTGPTKIKSRRVDPKAVPVALEGSSVKADTMLPFTLKHSTLGDMHPILSGFLERMENHKYLCAMIGSRMLGFKHAYTPYIYGAGGDGKTTFTTFLDKAVKGCTGILDLGESSAYGLYNCVDKAFLFIHDTSIKNVYFYESVKKISGADAVKVNGKYQHPRDMILPGMIIITSNQLPNTSSEIWYKRRARIFKVSKMPGIVRESQVDTDMASDAMLSSLNEFWNYCLQCLDEVGNREGGKVNDLPNQEEAIRMSESTDDVYEDFFFDLNYVLDPSVSIDGRTLRNKVRKKAQEMNKDSFFYINFLEYLVRHKGVSKNDKVYIGIGIKQTVSDGHTKFIGKTAA